MEDDTQRSRKQGSQNPLSILSVLSLIWIQMPSYTTNLSKGTQSLVQSNPDPWHVAVTFHLLQPRNQFRAYHIDNSKTTLTLHIVCSVSSGSSLWMCRQRSTGIFASSSLVLLYRHRFFELGIFPTLSLLHFPFLILPSLNINSTDDPLSIRSNPFKRVTRIMKYTYLEFRARLGLQIQILEAWKDIYFYSYMPGWRHLQRRGSHRFCDTQISYT